MLDATTAAHSLITLASPTKQNEDSGLTTPPRKDSIQNMEYESPDHTRHVSITCKGTKRPRENLVLVLYDAGETELAIPFIRGEDPQLFFQRRDKITRETLEADIRNDVYCTWRKEMLSVLINDKRWQLIRDSPQFRSAMCTTPYSWWSLDTPASSGVRKSPAATAQTLIGVQLARRSSTSTTFYRPSTLATAARCVTNR